ncbi:MAG: hypothetical protein ACHQHN_09365 [Sphingobacteriales bacterium]
MNYLTGLKKKCRLSLLLAAMLFLFTQSFAQKPANWKLEKMPVKLETDFALSCLPPYLRANATVYLIDPDKGYYVGRKGSNGFVCFVTRTEWEWGEFRNDIASAISYDAEGARTIFKVYQDLEAMRASGKYTALQVKSIITDRIRKGIYKAPARTGVSFMLAPVMRSYTGSADQKDVMTMNMPHYMFYAPYLTNADIGNKPDGSEDGPLIVNSAAPFLGDRKAPFGYIIVSVGQTKKAKIMKDNQDLLKRLIAYKAYFGTMSNMKH